MYIQMDDISRIVLVGKHGYYKQELLTKSEHVSVDVRDRIYYRLGRWF